MTQPRILVLDGVDPALARLLHLIRVRDCQAAGHHRPIVRHDVGFTCSHCGLILDGVDP